MTMLFARLCARLHVFYTCGVVLWLLAAMATAPSLHAQPRLKATVNAYAVEEGSALRVSYALEGADGDAFEAPPFEHFEVVSGPNVERSYTVINGRTNIARRYSYDLYAAEVGTFTIPPARIDVAGKKITSNALTIKVSPAAMRAEDSGIVGDAEVRVVLSRDTAYVGEEVRVQVDLYNRVDVRTYSVVRPLRFDNLRGDNLRNFRANERQVELEGQAYRARTLQLFSVFADKPGVYPLGPTVLRLNILDPKGRRRGFFFAPPTKPLDVTSDRRELVVLPLPNDAPPSFSGAVGDWRFEGRHEDIPNMTTADALTYRLFVQGQGELNRLRAPALAWPEGWRSYPPEMTFEQTVETDTGIVHTRTYEYTVVPQRGGRFAFSPEASYFDTQLREYVTWKDRPFTLAVNDNGTGAAVFEAEGGPAAVTPYLGTPRPPHREWVGEAWYRTLLLSMVGASLAALFYFRWQARTPDASSTAYVHDPVAEGKRRLQAARLALANPQAFYTEVRTALEQFAQDRLGLAPSEQAEAQIRQAFAKTGYAPGLVEQFVEARALADRGLYGGGTDAAGRERALAELEVLLSQ